MSISRVFNVRELVRMAAVPDPRQGVFETLLVHGGQAVELEAHLARLEASLVELFPEHMAPELDIAEIPLEHGAMRIDLAPEGDRLDAEVSFRKIAGGREKTALNSFAVAGGLGRHKWRDRALVDAAQARLGGLPLIVDTDGAILEAARANVFAVRNDALLTPPLDGRILPGVTRMRVLALGQTLGIECHERPLSRRELLEADEVFLTGSVRGIERVAHLDGVPLHDGDGIATWLASELWQAWTGAKTAARAFG